MTSFVFLCTSLYPPESNPRHAISQQLAGTGTRVIKSPANEVVSRREKIRKVSHHPEIYLYLRSVLVVEEEKEDEEKEKAGVRELVGRL